MEQKPPKTREEIVQDLVDLHSTDNQMAFLKGAIIERLLKWHGDKKSAIKTAMKVMGCSYNWASFLLNLAQTFWPDHFYPDIAISIYRTCLTTDDPLGWLDRASRNEWTNKTLSQEIAKAQGKPVDTKDAGTEAVVKTKGKIKRHRDGKKLLIESDKEIEVPEDFVQGMEGYVRVER